jgi:hypothetical protein
VPRVQADTLFTAQGLKDFHETIDLVWRERDGFIDRVDKPAQHYLGSGPEGFAFQHFLDRRRLVMLGMKLRIQGGKDLVNGVKEGSAYAGALAPVTLT